MGDKVTCIAVLKKNIDPTRSDYLYLVTGPEGLRVLPCRPSGQPRKGGGEPEWEYREEGSVLHVHPSLLATDTGFHTDYNWTCQVEVCPEGESAYDVFMRLNPEVRERNYA